MPATDAAPPSPPRSWVPAVIVALVAGTFLVDCLTPLGIVEWLFYLLPVTLTIWTPAHWPFRLAAVATVLTVAGFFTSPPGVAPALAATNRALGVAVLWLAAALITQHIRVSAALVESAARLRLAAEAANVGLWDWDLQANTVFFSPEWKRQIGCRDDEITNEFAEWQSRVHPDDLEPTLAKVRAFLADPQARHEVEFRLRHKDGTYRWIYTHADVQRDAAGRPVRMLGCHIDITERKRAEAVLQQERDFSDGVLASLPGVFYCYDENLKFRRWNRNFERLSGHTGEEIARMSPLDFFAGAEKDLLARRIREVFDKGASAVEADFVAKDGTRTPHYFTGLTTMIEGRRHLVGVGIDISARRAAEAERQKFFLLAESSSEFIGMCDLDLQPLYVNPAGVRMVGLADMAAACRVKVQDYFFPEDQRFIAEEFFPRVLRDGHGDVEIRLRHFQTGAPIWMFYYLFSVRDATGAAVGWATVSRDITERKRAEAELRESHARLKKVLEVETVGVMFWDLTTGCLVDANDTFLNLMGYSRADVEARALTWQRLTPPEYVEVSLAEIRKFQTSGRVGPYEKEYLRKDGTRNWFVFAGSALGPDSCVEFCVDISDRKKAEAAVLESREQLRALLARLQRAQEEERTRVAREIHDELGQLLTGLKMDTRWLERKLAEPGVPPAFAPLLDRAVAASELADTTIAAVRKLAAELRPGALDQLGLAAALAERARLFEERAGVRCTVTAPEPPPALPPATATELYYICQEALTNVARHAQATAVAVQLAVEGGAVRLTVSDDGVGLGAVEGHRPQSLGLVGMRERAGRCGGSVEIGPNEPRGTRVTVRVPLRSGG